MPFDPFAASHSTNKDYQKKRVFLVGNGQGRVHFLVKMALYRGQSINFYHLITKERRKLNGRTMGRNFDSVRDQYLKEGIELRYPNDIPEADTDRWVEFGRTEAKKKGLEINE
jgi:hypothetical protein